MESDWMLELGICLFSFHLLQLWLVFFTHVCTAHTHAYTHGVLHSFQTCSCWCQPLHVRLCPHLLFC